MNKQNRDLTKVDILKRKSDEIVMEEDCSSNIKYKGEPKFIQSIYDKGIEEYELKSYCPQRIRN